MKKTAIAFLVLAAMTAALSCEKAGNPELPVQEDFLKISVCADAQTKAHFGDKSEGIYPIEWSASFDNAAVLASGLNGSTATTVSADGATATFEFSRVTMRMLQANTNLMNVLAEDDSVYTFCVYSPFDNNYSDSHKVNERGGAYAQPSYVRIWVPTVQTPSAGSPDQNAVLLYGQTSAQVSVANLHIPDLNLGHLTAYGKLSLANLGLERGETVESVVLTAGEGEWIAGGFGHQYNSGAMTLNAGVSGLQTNRLTVNTTASENIMFALRPGTLNSLNVTVSTSKGATYSKDLNLSGNPLVFTAGQVKAFGVDMTGLREEAQVLTEAWIDFGNSKGTSTGYNCIATVPTSPQYLKNYDGTVETMASIKATGTGLSLTNNDAFNSDLIVKGITWEKAVWKDYFYATSECSLELAGLETNRTYKLLILCARDNATHTDTYGPVRATEVTIGEDVKTAISGVKAGYESYADDLCVEFSAGSPDADGKITMGLKGVGKHSTAGNQIIVSAIRIIRN